MKKIIFLLYVVLFYSCATQRNLQKEVNYIPYYLKVYEADSLRRIDKNLESYTVLNTLFKKYKPLNLKSYYEYRKYIRDGYIVNKLKGEELKLKVIDLIKNYGFSNKYLKYDSIFNKIYQESEITNAEYNNLRKKYLSKIDLKLRDTLVSMLKWDQFYRNEYDGSDKSEKWKITDKKNSDFLVTLFNKKIYPNSNVIGNHTIDKSNAGVLILLLHTKDSIRTNYFLPKVKDFFIKGECQPSVYAYMVDQYHLYNKEKQVYGTINITRIDKNNYTEYNKMRKSIGLPTLEYELWKRKN